MAIAKIFGTHYKIISIFWIWILYITMYAVKYCALALLAHWSIVSTASRRRLRSGELYTIVSNWVNSARSSVSCRHVHHDRPVNLLRPTFGAGDSATLIKVTTTRDGRRYFTITGQDCRRSLTRWEQFFFRKSNLPQLSQYSAILKYSNVR